MAKRGECGYGVDDGAGILVRGERPLIAVSGSGEAGAWRVQPDGRGRARELELRRLRALRAGRAAVQR